jgi:hypothetical protein
MRPVTTNKSKITSSKASVPDGAYPQLRLCGHAGTTPININTRITNRTVTTSTSLISLLYRIARMRPSQLC